MGAIPAFRIISNSRRSLLLLLAVLLIFLATSHLQSASGSHWLDVRSKIFVQKAQVVLTKDNLYACRPETAEVPPQKTYTTEAAELKLGVLESHHKWVAKVPRFGPGQTLKELMRLASDFKPATVKYASVTVILNHYMRNTLCSQLNALLSQTVQPEHIWICVFNSSMLKAYQDVVSVYNDTRITLIASQGFDFRYYGRFQQALQATTEHVLVLDDDIVPGRNYLKQLMHISNTKPMYSA
eukprot:Colp12_sorted_trinity150504_noHs@12534